MEEVRGNSVSRVAEMTWCALARPVARPVFDRFLPPESGNSDLRIRFRHLVPGGVREVGWGLQPPGASIEPDEVVQMALGGCANTSPGSVEYFAGQRREFTLPLDLPPIKPVSEAVLTYGELAEPEWNRSPGAGDRGDHGGHPSADHHAVPRRGRQRWNRWIFRRRAWSACGDQALAAGERRRTATRAGLDRRADNSSHGDFRD